MGVGEEVDDVAAIEKDLRDDGEEEEGGTEEGGGGGRKEARRRKKRSQREKRRVLEQVHLVLPPPLIALLEVRMAPVGGAAESSLSSPISDFAGAPPSLRLRGFLLVFSLVLRLLHPQPSAQVSPSALSPPQRSLLLSFLRDEDLLSPFLTEVVEHLLLTHNPPPQAKDSSAEYWLADTEWSHSDVQAQSVEDEGEEEEEGEGGEESCPPSPLPSQSSSPLYLRPAASRRLRALLSSVSARVLFPSLCFPLYLRGLHLLPALCRSWWTNVGRQSASLIAEFTAQHCSPLLIGHELSNLSTRPPLPPSSSSSTSTPSELTISPSLSSSSVTAHYRAGEVEMSLCLRLPPSYPLLPPTVELSDGVRVQAGWTKRWQLSITTSLLSSNGGLYEAIQGFFLNVDGHFAGVTDCAICYSVLHATHHTLPRMTCRTCQHRFHSQCLLTWFNKSGMSTCPLCRTPF